MLDDANGINRDLLTRFSISYSDRLNYTPRSRVNMHSYLSYAEVAHADNLDDLVVFDTVLGTLAAEPAFFHACGGMR